MLSSNLPHWDFSTVFPSLESPEFAFEFSQVIAQIHDLVQLFDALHIQKLSKRPAQAEAQQSFTAVVTVLTPLLERAQTLRAYINGFTATDSRNTLAQARMSEYSQAAVKLAQLNTRLVAWIGSLDVEALLGGSETARDYEYLIRRSCQRAAHLMSPAEENLAAELNLNSGLAWGRLYNNLTSQITVHLEQDGRTQTLPISAVRNLAYVSDPKLRLAGYEIELAAWREHALPLSTALNSIKGEVITLARRRGWGSPLETALFDNAIDPNILEPMLQAATAFFPHFRRYLQAKARLLGKTSLPWYDLFAPVGSSEKIWPYEEARELIIDQFGAYSIRMGHFAERAFRENWIDAEPRPGKRDGAFCMRLRRDESRILTNFQPGFKSVLTLAHELGHGYHNLNLASQPILNRETPMTLAETASIFCETIVRNALLKQVDPAERIGILEAALVNATQIVVDISSRFLFEQAVFNGRKQRDLSIDELCQAMTAAQMQTYGEGLDPQALHPYMWAAKSHYYSSGLSYYNFPYMFGLLFGLGLYARYLQDPARFKANYDHLLASTGVMDAAGLATSMGIDIRSLKFWQDSLETIKMDIDQFVELSS